MSNIVGAISATINCISHAEAAICLDLAMSWSFGLHRMPAAKRAAQVESASQFRPPGAGPCGLLEMVPNPKHRGITPGRADDLQS